MKILVIRFSSIGDIVLTTPVVRTLKTQIGDVEVHYLTKEQYRSILEENPYVSKVWTLPDSLTSLASQLRREKFDWVIDLHNNIRTRIIRLLVGRPSKSFSKLNISKWLLVNAKINRLPNRHIVDRYMDTVSHLNVKMDTLGLDYFIPEKDEIETGWLPQSHRMGFVAVVIGGKHATKRLPTKRLIELCDRINKPIVLLGGKEDQLIGDEIERFFKVDPSVESEKERVLREDLGKKAEVYNACGKFNLNQSASILKESIVVFSHDTGLMHIAAALGKKIYSIWGNTIPEFGMYPYRTQFVIFENKKLKCRPCSKIGFSQCPKGHFKCMNEVVFDFYISD